MTPTRQAGSLLLAGLVSVLTLPCAAHAAQDTSPQQPAAPIVRVPPRPSTHTQTQSRPATATTPGGAPLAPRPVAAPAIIPGRTVHTPETVSGVRADTEQKPAPILYASGLNRNVIVLDPGHGGTDSGARIGDATLEKNVTLALAFRLRSLLTARGFTVVLTRDSDAATEPNNISTPLTLDDRAGIANHARAAACLLLHATGRGTGVHLYSSELDAAPGEASSLPWLTAQAAWVPASQALEQQLGAALGRSHIALVSSTASVRPVDSLTCPALVVELAPDGDDPNSVNDAEYQQRVAAAVAAALVFWKNAVQPPPHLAAPAIPHHMAHHVATEPATATPETQP